MSASAMEYRSRLADRGGRLLNEKWKLKSAGTQTYGFTYTYDAAGNRLTRLREFATGVKRDVSYYDYNLLNGLTRRHVLPSDAFTYYEYNGNGSLIRLLESGGTTYFAYGFHGLVSQVKPPAGQPWNFFYDSRLNRYAVDRGGSLSYFLWDGMNLLEERDLTGTLVAQYTHGYTPIPGIGSIVEAKRLVSGTTYFQYLHMDQQGSVANWTDATQSVRTAYTYDPLGLKETEIITDVPGIVDPPTIGPRLPYTPVVGTSTPMTDPLGPTIAGQHVKDTVSQDLWSHYINGGGNPFDLTKYHEVLDALRDIMFRELVEEKYIKQAKAWLDAATTCPMPAPWAIVGNGFRSVDFFSRFPAIGKANVRVDYVCMANYICACPKSGGAVVPTVGGYTCSFTYVFYDQFRDAADWSHSSPGDQEYAGGTRFDEIGSWVVTRSDRQYLYKL